jgi:hypothetical protein
MKTPQTLKQAFAFAGILYAFSILILLILV